MALAEVKKLIEDCISMKGVHLIDLELKGEGNGKSLDVFIDSETGITTEICSEVSREVDRLIDSAGFVRGSYRLTVSSPGIGRPLKYVWQYKKHVGRLLDLQVRSEEGTKRLTGKLLSVGGTSLVISAGAGSGQETIALDGILEARVKAPW